MEPDGKNGKQITELSLMNFGQLLGSPPPNCPFTKTGENPKR